MSTPSRGDMDEEFPELGASRTRVHSTSSLQDVPKVPPRTGGSQWGEVSLPDEWESHSGGEQETQEPQEVRQPKIPEFNPIDPPPSLSPREKSAFKTEFLKPFREIAQSRDYERASEFVASSKAGSGIKLHWRMDLQLAGLAQKLNMIDRARGLYASVHAAVPGDAQAWLAAAKMEQSLGNHDAALELLNSGLSASPVDESLFVAALRHHEKYGSLLDARALLSLLLDKPVNDTWKMVLEGALMEVRAGNLDAVRDVFGCLMEMVPWYGPVYNEALVAELGGGNLGNAVAIIHLGLSENPRYGPLWFGALRVFELIHSAVVRGQVIPQPCSPYGYLDDSLVPRPATTVKEAQVALLRTVHVALESISRELAWKVHHVAAHMLFRVGEKKIMLKHFACAALRCPPNLVWKVWVHAARMELQRGSLDSGRAFVKQALHSVPAKLRHVVLIEAARLEEFTFDLESARDVLASALTTAKDGWKVHLEMVLLELRAGLLDRATASLLNALEVFPTTGRLWALLIQLRAYSSFKVQQATFHAAVYQVPKSGEVWCEGARLYLNPLSSLFDLEKAADCLKYAMLFTPQYGDSLVESLLLAYLTQTRMTGPDGSTMFQDASGVLSSKPPELLRACALSEPNYGMLWYQYKAECGEHATAREVLSAAALGVESHLDLYATEYQLAVLGGPGRTPYLQSCLSTVSELSSLKRLLGARESARGRSIKPSAWFSLIYGSDHLSI